MHASGKYRAHVINTWDEKSIKDPSELESNGGFEKWVTHNLTQSLQFSFESYFKIKIRKELM